MSMLSRVLGCVAVAIALTAPVPAARADEFTDRANNLYSSISNAKRSDLVVLPVVAKMKPPPAVVGTVEKAMMLPASSASFSAAKEWAAGETQQAVLAALDQVTKEEKLEEAYAFGQPYGSESVASTTDGIVLINAGLYTDLGDQAMLAAARHLYLQGLDQVACLVHVEATRQAAEGNFDKALDVLIDWLFFSRQIADRAFFREARWGWRSMIASADRIRDVVYTDFRGAHKITNDQIAAVLERIRADGYISVDKINVPVGDYFGGDQVIAKVFIPKGRPNDAVFGSTMARLAATQRPLRLFAEAARWNEVAAKHGDWFDTTKEITGIRGDLRMRWPLEATDQRLRYTSDYEKMSKTKYAVLAALIPDASVLFNDRQILRTQLVGTRISLGIMAFQNKNKNWPPDISSIRPLWVKVIEADPFNLDRGQTKVPPLEYFVPIRDTKNSNDPRVEPRPHEINVVTRGGQYNFKAKVGQDQFVLYSVGPDHSKDWAKNVSGEPPDKAVGDLLLWPPVTSLLRQRLVETGELK